MKSDRSCWVGFAAGVGCWVRFAAGVGWAWVAGFCRRRGLGLAVGCWVGFAAGVGWVWPWVAGLGLPPAWVGFGRGLLGWVWEGMGSAGEDGYG
jgi:hypothetical protein